MAELFAQVATSLDGYVEDAAGSIEWMVHDHLGDPASLQATIDTLRSIDGMIFGRRAYDLMADYWPDAADRPGQSEGLVAQARLMNQIPKYVLTRGKEIRPWGNSRPIEVSDIPALTAAAERAIAVFAGAGAIQATLDFIDRIVLQQYPVILGGGLPLFPSGGRHRRLELVESQVRRSGVVVQHYRLAR